MMRASLVLSAAIIAILTAASPTHAAPGATAEHLALQTPTCPTLPFDGRLFESLVVVELRDAGITVDPRASSRLVVSEAACAPAATAVDIVFERARGTERDRRARHVELADVAIEARPRTLALIATELVGNTLATWPDAAPRAPDPAPAPGTTIVVAPAGARAWEPPRTGADAPVMRSFVAGLALAHRAFPVDDTSLTGLELRASIRLTGPLRLRTAIVGLYDRSRSELGLIHFLAGSGAIGVSAGMRGDLFGFDVGPRLDVGAAVAEGHAEGADVVATQDGPVAATVTLGLDAEVQLYVTKGLLATVGLEAGGAIAGLQATVGDRVLASTTGPFFGLRVGVAIAP